MTAMRLSCYLFAIGLFAITICRADEESLKEKVSISLQNSKDPHVLRIVINNASEGITSATLVYVRSAVEYCQQKKPALVILELNTPGGEVYAAQQIGNALRGLDTKEGIPVIAYINNWAISAGAMLAYSCRYIVASPDASMGAACPVTFTKDEMKEAPEKVNSALRSDFANRAAFFDRNPDIARAMVDEDIILVRREEVIMGLMSENDLQPTDIILSHKGKLLTLTSQQLKTYGVADYCIDKKHAGIPDEVLPRVLPVSKTSFASVPGFENFQAINVETYEMPLKTNFFVFLASPTISSDLFFIVCICVYMEMSSPGIFIPALIGVLCFSLMLLGSFAQQAIAWFEPMCIMAGIGLIATELIAFPTCGFLLVIGGIFALCGITSLLLPGLKEISVQGFDGGAAGQYVLRRLGSLFVAFCASLLFLVPIMRIFMKKIEMHEKASEKPQLMEPSLLGKQGVVVAALRPSGKILLDEQVYDAQSEGQFVEEGTVVRVISQQETKVIVKKS